MRFEELLKRSAEKAAKQAAEETAKKVTEEVTREVTEKVSKETQKQILCPIDFMINAGESDQISHLRSEPDFLNTMLNKYHLLHSKDNIQTSIACYMQVIFDRPVHPVYSKKDTVDNILYRP